MIVRYFSKLEIEEPIEIVDTAIWRRINFMFLQKTKWVGEKARELDNRVGIIVDKEWKKHVLEVKGVGDRIIVGLAEHLKVKLRKELEGLF
ncbi:hypothetical protein MTR_8g067700 [Medicago truncatula]|uniref:Uncharacterized protein n=1 Tax=Medicago truncatula TaxID=3880 RepID=G7LIG1_MEDTR|nr:hypothetical protein MTR_8g067700 [Medicago truncatula]